MHWISAWLCDKGDPPFLPPASLELNFEIWGFRVQKRMSAGSPGHCQMTLPTASNPEALESGLDPYRKPTGTINNTQGTNRLLQASIHATMYRGTPSFREARLESLGVQNSVSPDLMGPAGSAAQEYVWPLRRSRNSTEQ